MTIKHIVLGLLAAVLGVFLITFAAHAQTYTPACVSSAATSAVPCPGATSFTIALPTTSPTPLATPTATPTPQRTASPSPTPAPTATPTVKPTATPTAKATATPASNALLFVATVSEVTSTGFNASGPIYAGYGNIPVTYASGVSISGTVVAGATVEVFGTVSIPNVTATAVLVLGSPTTVPTPVVTAKPTVAPSSAPTSAPSVAASGVGCYTGNATDGCTPYQGSFWTSQVPASPKIATWSAAVVADQFPSGMSWDPIRANEAGQYDYNHPRFVATTNDVKVSVKCSQYCAAALTPSTIYIPAQARPAGGGDGHIDIVQPDGTEVSAWGASSPDGSYHNYPSRNWQSGDTLTAGAVVNCGSITSGDGMVSTDGPTAAGYCDAAGSITAAELAAGNIPHALFVTGQCGGPNPQNVFPSESGASTQNCTSGVGPPLGGREWYDVPCATTKAAGYDRALTAELCALNIYGGFFADNGDGGANFTGGVLGQVESEEPWYDYNGASYTSPFAVMSQYGWTPASISAAQTTNGGTSGGSGTRWFDNPSATSLSTIDFKDHIHWLDPCVTQGNC